MPFDPKSPFSDRVRALPRLGLGISTEFGAGRTGLDINALRRLRPDLVSFLEIGVDLERGVDADAWQWVRSGGRCTYHFLDLNLEEADDLVEADVLAVKGLATELKAAWICGDAGLWYVGRRDRGHGALMPPILCPESADEMARGVLALREGTGFEVLPENPPAHVYLGDLHLLDYYARVAGRADSGLLLDAAHLAVYQLVTGHAPLDGLDGYPIDRVVEIHVAGGTTFESGGKTFVDDDHGLSILPGTRQILEAVIPRATSLKAVVLECERNRIEEVVPIFEMLKSSFFTQIPA